ncbi:unnamed protein product [Phytophthora fragariaefolia]|uniref:Unnamed protein product n=1 Tax=Phytophthora fragariaefolia TaxID=1490495 RepID=A0A9W6Y7T4_9STRA|nr:unnamed protein product [Phytophthora fragariaefolia]
MLYEASGLDSEEEDEPAAATTRSAPEIRLTRTSSVYEDDVNVWHEGERSSDYESYSTDESDDSGIDDDESNPGDDFAADDDDILSDSKLFFHHCRLEAVTLAE